MAESYRYLAEWFEYLNDDCDYLAWSQYFIDGLRKLNAGSAGLELGCGSGAFARALSHAGFHMSGADISLPMLTKAERMAREEGLPIKFFYADAASMKTPEKYDFILSPNDCYNYIPQEKLPVAFKGAARALKKGGLFWFDISSAEKLRKKVANNIFADDREQVTYLCFNKLKERSVEMDVTLFVKRADGAFDRFDENHTQYIHTEKDVCKALEPVFTVLAVEGHLGGDREEADRLNFICQKR